MAQSFHLCPYLHISSLPNTHADLFSSGLHGRSMPGIPARMFQCASQRERERTKARARRMVVPSEGKRGRRLRASGFSRVWSGFSSQQDAQVKLFPAVRLSRPLLVLRMEATLGHTQRLVCPASPMAPPGRIRFLAKAHINIWPAADSVDS